MKKKQTFFADVLNAVTKYFLVIIAAIVTYLLCSGIRIVDSGNVALVLRFGRLVGQTQEEQIHGPGLLFAFPYFIDEVVVIPSDSVMEQTVSTHYTSPETSTGNGSGYLITGDQNIAVVSASVKYVVSDPVKYALHVKEIDRVLNAAVSTGMVNESARIGVDDLLTSGKDDFGRAVLDFAAQKLDHLGAGIRITSLELTQVSMPNEVKDIYDQVNAATVEAETKIEYAKQYRENLIPDSHGKANTLITGAETFRAQEVAAANTAMSEFWGHLDEYRANPEVVRTRIFAEKQALAISKIKTVRVVQDGETQIIINP